MEEQSDPHSGTAERGFFNNEPLILFSASRLSSLTKRVYKLMELSPSLVDQAPQTTSDGYIKSQFAYYRQQKDLQFLGRLLIHMCLPYQPKIKVERNRINKHWEKIHTHTHTHIPPPPEDSTHHTVLSLYNIYIISSSVSCLRTSASVGNEHCNEVSF